MRLSMIVIIVLTCIYTEVDAIHSTLPIPYYYYTQLEVWVIK